MLSRDYPFSLTRESLLDSKNPAFEKEGGRTLDVTSEGKGSGREQLIRDTKGLMALAKSEPCDFNVFWAELTEENKKRIEEHNNTQGHLELLNVPSIPSITQNSALIIKQPDSKAEMKISGEGDAQEVFLKAEGYFYPVFLSSGLLQGYIPGSVEIIYKLTTKGWEYQIGGTDSEFLHQLFAGKTENISESIKKELMQKEKSNEEKKSEKVKQLIKNVEKCLAPLKELAEKYEKEQEHEKESNLIFALTDPIYAMLTQHGKASSLSELCQETDEVFQKKLSDLWHNLHAKITNDAKSFKNSFISADPTVMKEVIEALDSLKLPASLDEAISPTPPLSENKKEEKEKKHSLQSQAPLKAESESQDKTIVPRMTPHFDKRYRIRKSLFEGSTNMTFSDKEIKQLINPPKAKNLDVKTEIGNIEKDVRGGIGDLTLNGTKLSNITLPLLNDFFPSHSNLINHYYSQLPAGLVGYTINLPLQINAFCQFAKDDYIYTNDIYEYEGNVYYKIARKLGNSIEDVTSKGNERPLNPTTDHHLEVLFQLTNDGFKFIEYQTNSLAIYEILMGAAPSGSSFEEKIEWFEKRDQRNLSNRSWLQRNVKMFEPVFHDSPLIPLTARLKNAFDTCFNEKHPARSRMAAFFAWPAEGTTTEKLLRYIVTGSFLAIIKNTVKLFTEFLPAAFEEMTGYGLELCNKFLSHPNNQNISFRVGIAHTARAILGTLYLGAKMTHQLGKRLTSPIESAKEAYAFGSKLHPAAGTVLAVLSVTVSVALVSLATVAFPILIPEFVKTAMSSIASWLSSSIPYLGKVGSMIATGVSKATGPFSLATEGLSSAATVALSTLPFMMGIKVSLSAAWNKFRHRKHEQQEKRIAALREKYARKTGNNESKNEPQRPSKPRSPKPQGVTSAGMTQLLERSPSSDSLTSPSRASSSDESEEKEENEAVVFHIPEHANAVSNPNVPDRLPISRSANPAEHVTLGESQRGLISSQSFLARANRSNAQAQQSSAQNVDDNDGLTMLL